MRFISKIILTFILCLVPVAGWACHHDDSKQQCPIDHECDSCQCQGH